MELYIFVTRLIALSFNVVKLPVTESLICVAFVVTLVHKLENHDVMELYIFVILAIAASFNAVNANTTAVFIYSARCFKFSYISTNHCLTVPTMPITNSVARCVMPENNYLIFSIVFVMISFNYFHIND